MKDRIQQTLILLYNFIKNPFDKSIENIDDNKSLVFIASVLSGLIVITRYLNTSKNGIEEIITLIVGILITPILGILIVHLKGGIFNFYLKHIASKIFKVPLTNVLKAKKIATFSTISLIISAFPSLVIIGVIVGIIIEILGLQRLFKIDFKTAIFVSLLYFVIWLAILNLLV